MKTRIALILATILAMGTIAQADIKTAKEAEETMKKEWPTQFGPLNYSSFKESPAPGLYEVVINGNILYFQPPKIFIFGEITRDGRSLTEERRGELSAENLKKLDLKKAVKIGSGKRTVIEFTDPDCPYCRKTTEFLNSKSELMEDVTKYVFFMPLPFHKDAPRKARYISCAKDQGKAYEEIFSGKLDGKELAMPTDCEAKDFTGTIFDITKPEQQAFMSSLGVTGTPTFYIDGKRVVGADTSSLERLLRK